MLTHKHSPIFGRFASIAARGFLLWTLTSSTLLDVSTTFVEGKLHTAMKFSDRTRQQVEMLLQHCLR